MLEKMTEGGAMIAAARKALDSRRNELREELRRLMEEQVDSLKAQTFGAISHKELRDQEERLKRIREVSADLLALLKENSL
jgi:hypothetical protein